MLSTVVEFHQSSLGQSVARRSSAHLRQSFISYSELGYPVSFNGMDQWVLLNVVRNQSDLLMPKISYTFLGEIMSP